MVRDVRWNADFDMKRKLVNVRDVKGLITADTTPWRSIDDFEQARDLLEEWKKSQRRVLKTSRDFEAMVEWGRLRVNRRRIGTRSHNKLAPVPAAVLKVLARRDTPFSEWFQLTTQAQKAQWMSAICGMRISETDVKNAKRRGAGLELDGSIIELTDDDRQFLDVWFKFCRIAPEAADMVWQLCAPGSRAADELDDLFWDARPEQEPDTPAEMDFV